MASISQKDFGKFMARDGACYHCGNDVEVSPHHRINRQAGGAPRGKDNPRNRPSNIIVVCSRLNDEMEKNAVVAAWAKRMGYKLESWQKPSEIAVYDFLGRVWWLLDDNFGRRVVEIDERGNLD